MVWWQKLLSRKPVRTREILARDCARHGWSIGDFTYGRIRIRHWGQGDPLVIGPYCSFADGIEIFLGGDHATGAISTYPFAVMSALFPKPIVAPSVLASKGGVQIGADVWIGSGATVMAGVTIGTGAVIGARTVVASNIPAYAIAVGNPARVVRQRFSTEAVAALLASRWWDLPPAQVADLAPLLAGGDWQALCAACAQFRASSPPEQLPLGQDATSR